MNYSFKAVETPIGAIEPGRNAIFLVGFEQKGGSLLMRAHTSSRFCSEEYRNYERYDYEILLKSVEAYKCENIELYDWRKWNSDYAISEVIGSEWGKKYGLNPLEYKHIIIETYDYFYSVLCKQIEVVITDRRS